MNKILNAAIASLLKNSEEQFALAQQNIETIAVYQAHLVTGMLCRIHAQSMIAARDAANGVDVK